MGLARPERAYRYALIATVGSVLGGIAGWLLGYYAYELVARPVLEFYGSLDKFELLRSSSSRDAILLMLITSGVAHLPPMKVVTILSGAAAVDIWLFIASAIVARGGKFFVIAWLLRRYGEPIRDFIEKRLGLIALGRCGGPHPALLRVQGSFPVRRLTAGASRSSHGICASICWLFCSRSAGRGMKRWACDTIAAVVLVIGIVAALYLF